MNQPLLSVIVPCYNVEKYIDKCIESIVNQSYANLEIILINDGSTDKTGYLCDSWAKKDERIKVIHKHNEGPSLARKNGIEASSGEYLAFIDSDDWIDPEMFTGMMNALINTNSEIAQCDFCVVEEDGSLKHLVNENKKGSFETVERTKGVLLILEEKIWFSGMCNKIFKKSLFDDIELPKERKYAEDFITLFLFHSAQQSVYVHIEYYFRLARVGSLCYPVENQAKHNNARDLSDALFERYVFVKQHLEYHNALSYIKTSALKSGIKLLNEIVDYPQYFSEKYFKQKIKELRSISLNKEDLISRKYKGYLCLLKISPCLYKFSRKLFRGLNRALKQMEKFMEKFVIKKMDIIHLFAIFLSKKLPLKADRYLVIAPHPDDEVFGCGGLLHKLASQGKETHVIILTKGEALYENPAIGIPAVIAKRREMALNAAEILGLKPNNYTFLDWGDDKFHETQNNETRKKELFSIIEKLKPEVIFTTHINESKDHVHATKLVSDTVRQYGLSVKIIYYCVWIFRDAFLKQLEWKKSYKLKLNKKERAIKNKAVDAYVNPVDEYGLPCSGFLYDLPLFCKRKREIFFET